MLEHERFDRCVLAVEKVMGHKAATAVCTEAVYASRGVQTRVTRSSRNKSKLKTARSNRTTRVNHRNKH